MKIRTIAGSLGGVAVIAASVFAAVPAFADDVAPPEAVTESIPVDTLPVEEVIVELTVADESTTQSTVPSFVPHAEHSRWLLPESWDYGTTPSYQPAIFPQDELTTELPCGRWSQDDTYWIENVHEQQLFDSLNDDGILTQGEDSAIYASHVFTKGPECEVPPVTCVSDGDWGSESDDTAPTQTAGGLVFTGGTGKAVGYGTAVSGNLQGLGEITVSATGDLNVFYPRIVIDSSADGGYSYDSLTVLSEGTVNGSSIAASNKRGFEQHTLDEWAAILPNNQLVAFFLHLDSGATAEQSVTVTAVSGECLSLDAVPEPEEPEYPGDLVDEGEWVDGEYDCLATQVSQTRTVTTKEYVLVENEWVLEAESGWDIAIEVGEPRALGAEEIAAKDATDECKPVVVVPPVPTANITAIPKLGAESAVVVALGVGFLVAGLFITTIAMARRRTE